MRPRGAGFIQYKFAHLTHTDEFQLPESHSPLLIFFFWGHIILKFGEIISFSLKVG